MRRFKTREVSLSEGLKIPFGASYGFVNILGWMLAVIGVVVWKLKQKEKSTRLQKEPLVVDDSP